MSSASEAGHATRLEIERRQLGASPLSIARISLGPGKFGGAGSAPESSRASGGTSPRRSSWWSRHARWGSPTHFDTADAYGGGRSETAVGRWIAARAFRPTMTAKTSPAPLALTKGVEPLLRLDQEARPSQTNRSWSPKRSPLRHRALRDSIWLTTTLARNVWVRHVGALQPTSRR
jgi:hypothetical protein